MVSNIKTAIKPPSVYDQGLAMLYVAYIHNVGFVIVVSF